MNGHHKTNCNETSRTASRQRQREIVGEAGVGKFYNKGRLAPSERLVLSKAGGTRLANANQHAKRHDKEHLYKLNEKAPTQVFLNFIYKEELSLVVETGPCCAMCGGSGNQQRLSCEVAW